jgi:hypothetical protein
MPTRNETLAFKALTDQVISRFKALTAGRYPKPGRAYDALSGNETYEQPKDEISERLMQLLEGMRSTMQPSDYKQAEIAVGEIMNLSKERIAEHHRAVNEAGSNVAGAAQDGNSYEWARDWCHSKGMSEDDISEFVSGLQRSDADQPPPFPGRPTRGGQPLPLTAQDRKRIANDAARAAASSSNRKSFDARYPNAQRMEPSGKESVSALHRHLAKIGVV